MLVGWCIAFPRLLVKPGRQYRQMGEGERGARSRRLTAKDIFFFVFLLHFFLLGIAQHVQIHYVKWERKKKKNSGSVFKKRRIRHDYTPVVSDELKSVLQASI